MAEDNRIQTPSSSTGLTRFYDVTASKVLLDPKTVMGFTLAFVALEIVLKILRV